MALKHFLLVLIVAVAVQASTQDDALLADLQKNALEMKEEMDVVVERFPNLEVSEIRDLLEVYVDVEKIIDLLIALDKIFGEGNAANIKCLIENLQNSDIPEEIKKLGEEIKRIVSRIQERDEQLEECDKIGGENASLIDQIRRRICRARVTGDIGVQVVRELRELQDEINALVEDIKNLWKCTRC